MTKRAAIRKLESFNNKCLRRVLGTTKAQQCISHITSAEIKRRFGMQETLDDVIVAKRLSWLDHVARMDNSRLPKRLLFSLATTNETSSWNQDVVDRLSEERHEAVWFR